MEDTLVKQMREWESTGKVGDGPADVREAAVSAGPKYRTALSFRYGFVTPTFDAPKADAGIVDGPPPHADTWSSGEKRWRNYLNQFETKVSGWRRPTPASTDWRDHVNAIGEALSD